MVEGRAGEWREGVGRSAKTKHASSSASDASAAPPTPPPSAADAAAPESSLRASGGRGGTQARMACGTRVQRGATEGSASVSGASSSLEKATTAPAPPAAASITGRRCSSAIITFMSVPPRTRTYGTAEPTSSRPLRYAWIPTTSETASAATNADSSPAGRGVKAVGRSALITPSGRPARGDATSEGQQSSPSAARSWRSDGVCVSRRRQQSRWSRGRGTRARPRGCSRQGGRR